MVANLFAGNRAICMYPPAVRLGSPMLLSHGSHSPCVTSRFASSSFSPASLVRSRLVFFAATTARCALVISLASATSRASVEAGCGFSAEDPLIRRRTFGILFPPIRAECSRRPPVQARQANPPCRDHRLSGGLGLPPPSLA